MLLPPTPLAEPTVTSINATGPNSTLGVVSNDGSVHRAIVPAVGSLALIPNGPGPQDLDQAMNVDQSSPIPTLLANSKAQLKGKGLLEGSLALSNMDLLLKMLGPSIAPLLRLPMGP